MKYNKEKGFTLIEFMVVIALIGIGLLFIVSQFKDAGDQNKSQTAIKNITSLASGISSFRDLRNGYTGVTHTGIASSSSAPTNMVVMVGGAPVLTNVFGGAVTVSGTATDYTVTYPSVPQKNCIDIASKLIGSFKTVKVGTIAVTNLSTVTTECKKAATDSIVFIGT